MSYHQIIHQTILTETLLVVCCLISVSIFTMGYVFFCACLYREVYLFEGMVVLGMFFLMLYLLYLVKQDPGSIRNSVPDDYTRTLTIPQNSLAMKSTNQKIIPITYGSSPTAQSQNPENMGKKQ